MVKVKLRVPLSSAPRETSSPLANPLRGAPSYSDDEDATPGAHHDGSDAALGRGDEELDDEELDDDDDDDDDDADEADELDEQDELEDEDEPTFKAASSSTPTKRRSITIKPRSSKGGASSSASPSVEGSASPRLGATKVIVKRPNLARMAQAQAMTVEELDALPAAKRRKTAKARGAAGPGRGWRKGLTKGQKPVYELPPAETTPASFGDTSTARASPSVKSEATSTPAPSLPKPKFNPPPTGESIKSSTFNPAAVSSTHRSAATSNVAAAAAAAGGGGGSGGGGSSIKIVSGPGGQTFTGDLNAKAGTAKNPGFRYPPLPSSRGGPPVQPLARIPTSFQSVIPLEKDARQPRRWLKAKREILSMGGRPWSIPVFYGGQDRGYEKKVDVLPTAGASVAAGAAGAAGHSADKSASKAVTPSKAVSPVPAATPAATRAGSTPAPAGGGAGGGATPAKPAAASSAGSPLPPPKHLGGLSAQQEANWRGQSPAFLFGGR